MLSKVNVFDGTVHTAEGRYFPDQSKVDGINMHAQTEEKTESKSKSFEKMSAEEQENAVAGGNDLIQKAIGEGKAKMKADAEKKKNDEIIAKAKKDSEDL